MTNPDEVELLLVRIQMMYDAAKSLKKDFNGLNEYEVVSAIMDTLKRQPRKPDLKVVT